MSTLGLEFSGNNLRILETDLSENIIYKSEFNFSFNTCDNYISKKLKDEAIAEFTNCIKDNLKFENSEYKTAGILIGTDQTFLSILPVDFNEDQNNIYSHILWELSNYFPDTYKDFNIKYYRLNNNCPDEKTDEALIIAVNKNKTNFLKNLCNAGNIKIKNIEIDQFTVEKCLKKNYNNKISDRSVLIIGCKRFRMDYSLLENDKLKCFDYDVIENSDFKKSVITHLNNYISSYNVGLVFLYGDDITDDIKLFIKDKFKNLSVSLIEYIRGNPDTKFSPLYGLVLKNL